MIKILLSLVSMISMHKSLKRGFTLIELLVVIAIIGILASIILASLATARSKGGDASLEEELSSTRSQAELYKGATTAVAGGVCTTATANLFGTANGGLGTILNGVIKTVTSANTYCAYGGTSLPNAGGSWVVAVKLTNGGYWCAGYYEHSGSTNASGVAYTSLSGTVATAAANTSTNRCN
jgi:prepilin-type N-terminal cleavage/methylation domain-containing protein